MARRMVTCEGIDVRVHTTHPQAHASACGHRHACKQAHLEDFHGDLKPNECGGGGSRRYDSGPTCTNPQKSSATGTNPPAKTNSLLDSTRAKHDEFAALLSPPFDLQHAPRLVQDHRRRNDGQTCNRAADGGRDGNAP
jgi:hypothetical protein